MAGMDGANRTMIVTGLTEPDGIVIDFKSSRLYWADLQTPKIQSSTLQGDDLQTLAHLTLGPYGIAVLYDRVYWSRGYYGYGDVQSSTKRGQDITIIVYTGRFEIRNLAVPAYTPITDRPNHCENQNCSNVCVLAAKSFRCLP